MKSILYIGATLMIGASIYGFVDYTQSKQKNEFKNMYTEKEKVVPVVIKKQELPTPVVQKEVVPVTSAKEAPKALVKKAMETKNSKMAVTTTAKKIRTTNQGNVAKTVTKADPPQTEKLEIKKKKRKISTKIFSRAPLDDEYEEEIIPITTSSKKTEVIEKTMKD